MVRSIMAGKDRIEDALHKFVGWAEGQPDILVMLNQGSRARTDYPADQWADLDLIIFTTDRDRYLKSSDWLESLGKPIITHLEKTAVGDELERPECPFPLDGGRVGMGVKSHPRRGDPLEPRSAPFAAPG